MSFKVLFNLLLADNDNKMGHNANYQDNYLKSTLLRYDDYLGIFLTVKQCNVHIASAGMECASTHPPTTTKIMIGGIFHISNKACRQIHYFTTVTLSLFSLSLLSLFLLSLFLLSLFLLSFPLFFQTWLAGHPPLLQLL